MYYIHMVVSDLLPCPKSYSPWSLHPPHPPRARQVPAGVAGKPRHISDILRPTTHDGHAAAMGGDRYIEEIARGLPPALSDPQQLPAVPPGVVTPLYHFDPLSEAKDRLWLYVRLATARPLG